MSRNSIVFSLGLLAGCSFVDDFDKFQPRESLAPGEDGGPSTPDAAATVDPGARPDAAAADAAVSDSALPDAAPAPDAAVPAPPDAAIPPDGFVPDAAVDAGPLCADLSCDDGDPCTANDCKAGVCVNPPIDADGDGYAFGVCKAGSSVLGGDCNDSQAAIKPGAAELCDGVDNNCDGLTDEGFSKVACYPDLDRDGFANLNVAAVLACSVCAAPTMAVANPTDKTLHDCYDVADSDGERVFPGQTNFYDQGYGPGGKNERSFDYDCSGVVETQYKPLSGGCGGLLGLLCDGSAGFSADDLPACGETGPYQICRTNGLTCEGNTESRKQLCH